MSANNIHVSNPKCPVCGSEITSADVIGPDNLCPDCTAKYGGLASIYCRTCKNVIGKTIPGKTDTGFEIKPGMVLHIGYCPNCRPGAVSATIEELDAYEKFKKIGGVDLN